MIKLHLIVEKVIISVTNLLFMFPKIENINNSLCEDFTMDAYPVKETERTVNPLSSDSLGALPRASTNSNS